MKILLNILHELQNKYGYLPREELEKVAEEFSIPLSRLYSFVTFYTSFSLKPKKREICICKGTVCSLKGSESIENAVREEYSVVRCFGACSMAPVVKIDAKLYGKVDAEKIRKLLSEEKDAREVKGEGN